MVEGKSVDVEGLTHKSVTLRYPYIEITNINDTTPLILSVLEKGDITVIGEYKGQRRVLGSISDSAYNMDKILRTHETFNYVEKDCVTEIDSIRKYLEVLSGWML